MSGLFKKKSGAKRNLRQKNNSGSDGEDFKSEEIALGQGTLKNGGGSASEISQCTSLSQPDLQKLPNMTVSAVSSSTKGSDLPTVPSSSSLLSFGRDEDDDEDSVMIKIKKSSHSRRLEKFRRKIRQQREQEKSGEAEPKLEAETKPVIPRQSPDSTVNFDLEEKVRVEEADSTNNYIPEEDEELREESQQTRKSVLEGGTIPDAQAVYLARKRRQKAREGGDYIPLDDTQRFPKEKSRLVRDDDNDESDLEEEGGRFYSTKKLRELEEDNRRQYQNEFLDIEQGESDEERDKEFAAWEREQIRKGVSSQQIQSMQQDQYSTNQYYAAYGTLGFPGTNDATRFYADTKDPEPMEIDMEIDKSITIINVDSDDLDSRKRKNKLPKFGGGESEKKFTLDDIILRLKSRMLDSGSVTRGRTLETEKLDSQLIDNELEVKRLEELRPVQNAQYNLYQETRAYTRDLLDCLNEKIERIDRLNEELMNLLKGRQQFLVRRRRQDIKDQFEECSLAGSGKLATVPKQADKMMRIADREARRTRRRQARENTLAGMSHQEGTSSDEEEAPSRIASFTADKEKLLKESETIFQDTLEEFSSVGQICEKFANWAEKDSDSYEDAYIGLCLAKLLAPILKAQLLAWNPFEFECPQLSRYSWFKESILMGSDRNLGICQDSVANLIPALVEKVICTKLAVLVSCAWDPSSSSQTGRLAAQLKSLIEEYPEVNAESKTVHRLLAAVEQRAKETLDDDLFMPIYAQEVIENTATGARAFLDRQFWFALKVFKNLVLFDGFLSTLAVQEMVLDGILNRQLVLGLQCSMFSESATIVKIRAIVSAIPTEWTKNVSDTYFRQMEPFSKLLRRVGEEAHKNRPESYRDTIKDVYKMLSQLGLKSHAKQFSEHLGLKL